MACVLWSVSGPTTFGQLLERELTQIFQNSVSRTKKKNIHPPIGVSRQPEKLIGSVILLRDPNQSLTLSSFCLFCFC